MTARKHRPPLALASKSVATGQVEIALHSDGQWVLVAIGRPRDTRRFNLSRAEAAALVAVLLAELPELRDAR